jgi:hypothetical protein
MWITSTLIQKLEYFAEELLFKVYKICASEPLHCGGWFRFDLENRIVGQEKRQKNSSKESVGQKACGDGNTDCPKTSQQ